MTTFNFALAVIKKIAQTNYNYGMDIFVECYTDEDLLELLADNDNCLFKTAAAMSEIANEHLDAKAETVPEKFEPSTVDWAVWG